MISFLFSLLWLSLNFVSDKDFHRIIHYYYVQRELLRIDRNFFFLLYVALFLQLPKSTKKKNPFEVYFCPQRKTLLSMKLINFDSLGKSTLFSLIIAPKNQCFWPHVRNFRYKFERVYSNPVLYFSTGFVMIEWKTECA